MKKRICNLFIILLFIATLLLGCSNSSIENKGEIKDNQTQTDQVEQNTNKLIDEDGKYTDPQDVADYIHNFSKLPSNFITKKEAAQLGWESSEGNLWDVTDEKSIGGDYFGNREGNLPKKDGRKWNECDVNYNGGYRGAERLVYSNDGLIYYTDDHYETFTQLY